LIEKIIEALKINNLKDAYVRIIITRGKGDLGLDPRKCQKATVIIIADRITLYPKELYEKGELGKIQFLQGSHHQDDVISTCVRSLVAHV